MTRSMKVPLLDLQAQYRPIRDEILAAMTRVADSQRFIMGPEIEALERELSGLLGIRHAITVSSGTDALLLALMALDIKAGDEVITPDVFVFRDGRLRVAAGCAAGPGGHRSGDVQHRSRAGCCRDHATYEGHHAGPSLRLERGSRSAPRSGTAAPGFRLSRTRHRRSARRITRVPPAESARSAASRSSRARTSARSATPAW